MRRQWVAALRMFLAITVVIGVLYPLAVTGIAQLAMRRPADGSLVTNAAGTVASAEHIWPGAESLAATTSSPGTSASRSRTSPFTATS